MCEIVYQWEKKKCAPFWFPLHGKPNQAHFNLMILNYAVDYFAIPPPSFPSDLLCFFNH